MDKRIHFSNAEMEEKGGIKAQHAVFRALQKLLREANSGWDVEETPVGSEADRQGVDIFLVHRAEGVRRPLDVAMYDKLAEGKGNEHTMVRVYPSWFSTMPDGSWVLLREREHALVRALLPTMSAPSHRVRGS